MSKKLRFFLISIPMVIGGAGFLMVWFVDWRAAIGVWIMLFAYGVDQAIKKVIA